jgi:hypothetical protein
MKLKDIVPYCLQLQSENGREELKYYWIINGLTYGIDSLQSYNLGHVHGDIFNCKSHLEAVNFINLSRYSFTNPNETKSEYDYLMLNLNNEITIFDKFIMVHKTQNEVTDCERKIFVRQNECPYYLAEDYYTIALFYTNPKYKDEYIQLLGGMETNLREIFKDLISQPVQSKPAELTLDEKVDDLVNELMKDSKSMAIKKLKRMLNERL